LELSLSLSLIGHELKDLEDFAKFTQGIADAVQHIPSSVVKYNIAE